MWNITGKPALPSKFRPFTPAEVLYAFDGPRIFVLFDEEEEKFLAYWSDESEEFNRYVVVPTSDQIVQSLKTGEISVLDALDQPRCWLCDVTHTEELRQCQRVEFADIPRDCLPSVGTILLPTLGSKKVPESSNK